MPSDREVIVCYLANPERATSGMGTSQEITKWGVKAISCDSREIVVAVWRIAAASRCPLEEGYTSTDVEQKAEWVESTLMKVLNNYATPL